MARDEEAEAGNGVEEGKLKGIVSTDMDERQMMHGVPYNGQNVAGWLMSEKMNGCRAYWDGAKLWNRSFREITAGPEILCDLPEGIELAARSCRTRTGATMIY